MAAIAVPNYMPWIFARWAMRMLMERAATHVTSDEDKYLFVQATALDGLDFELVEDPEQRRRLARATATAADELRVELMNGPQDDPRDGQFAEHLGELSLQLYDLFGEQEEPSPA